MFRNNKPCLIGQSEEDKIKNVNYKNTFNAFKVSYKVIKNESQRIKFHGCIRSVVSLPDEKIVVDMENEGIQILDMESKKFIKLNREIKSSKLELLTNDSLLSRGEDIMKIIDIKTLDVILTIDYKMDNVISVSDTHLICSKERDIEFSSEHQQCYNNHIYIIDLSIKEKITVTQFNRIFYQIFSITKVREDLIAVVCQNEICLLVWCNNQLTVKSVTKHNEEVSHGRPIVTNNGRQLVSYAFDLNSECFINVWDITTLNCIQRITIKQFEIIDAELLPDGRTLVCSALDVVNRLGGALQMSDPGSCYSNVIYLVDLLTGVRKQIEMPNSVTDTAVLSSGDIIIVTDDNRISKLTLKNIEFLRANYSKNVISVLTKLPLSLCNIISNYGYPLINLKTISQNTHSFFNTNSKIYCSDSIRQSEQFLTLNKSP